ncbi:hypothetical protein QZH56_22840 [Streptomyces olivoreticuli]|uniref:hypothetical protein n=1 Tax=Streptomyces olivoreticuli TaxID=68246 RepID=UPI002657ABEE|nr:hypothetical protein [Streptomyces olivoreticuli]WKK21677.1 hypothetical protein QZH56_22840 [Streptomyces olivoreticuli]
MFEIRIICDPADTERITTALNATFSTGAVRRLPSRHSDRARLYITADHRPEQAPWPTPETAYATAPDIASEIGWIARTTAEPDDEEMDREYDLRKAALLDRIDLRTEPDEPQSEATEAAVAAALRLMETDKWQGSYSGILYRPGYPEGEANLRGYVRQEYAAWLLDHKPAATATQEWADDQTAYEGAPSVMEEMASVLALVKQLHQPGGRSPAAEREQQLRKAALLDRIALKEAATFAPDVAANAVETAEAAAVTFALVDHATGHRAHPEGPRSCRWAAAGHRGYVRQEYARWLADQ